MRIAAECLLAASPAVVVAGLAGSAIAPVLYGQRIAGQNHLSHHLVRGMVVIALAVLYWLPWHQLGAIDAVLRRRQTEIRAARGLIRAWSTEIEDWLANTAS